jgi:uncharacterized protein Yka (UPF0111/DUF47 family)
MTNEYEASYFRQQSRESVAEYLSMPDVTPREDNVIYAEKVFKINSVLEHIAKMFESGENLENFEKLLYLLDAVEKYTKNEKNIKWFNGELVTYNKGE